MMHTELKLRFLDIGSTKHSIEEAAHILTDTFTDMGKGAWPELESARREVLECLEAPRICIGAFDASAGEKLYGWVGLRPLYETTWELHPLVVRQEDQGRGIGRRLMAALETIAQRRGIRGILLGTDDETSATSLSQTDLTGNNVLQEIQQIRNLKQHPFAFYQRCGYAIVGVVPDAGGERKPDIWMWKRLCEMAQKP